MNEVEDEEELLNFCFGHEDSELLFVPYSPVVNFINHGGRKPNAEIRWPKDSANEWLETASVGCTRPEWKDNGRICRSSRYSSPMKRLSLILVKIGMKNGGIIERSMTT